MKKYLFITIFGCVLLTVAILMLINSPPISYVNEGKLVFETEQEYGQFKRAVGQDGIEIDSILVLSSDPPIVVDFMVTRDAGIQFAYGEERVNNVNGFDYLAMLAGAGVLVVVYGIISLCSNCGSKESQ